MTPPASASPPQLRADSTRADAVRSAAAALAALDPSGLGDLGRQLTPEIAALLLAPLLARRAGASALANALQPAACESLAAATRAVEDRRKEEEELEDGGDSSEGEPDDEGSEGDVGDVGGSDDAPTGAECGCALCPSLVVPP